MAMVPARAALVGAKENGVNLGHQDSQATSQRQQAVRWDRILKLVACSLLLVSTSVAAQESTASLPAAPQAVPAAELPAAPPVHPVSAALPVEPVKIAERAAAHHFWDRQNIWLFAGVAAARSLDYASTRNMLARGREEILLPDDVVNNHAGFAALEAASTATSIGLSYLLHRTGHHRLERWLSIGHIGVTTFGDARNYALKSHRVR
jgi:hypothetical protein